MVVLIWPAMSGNGVLTGMMIIIMQIVLTEILGGLPMAPFGSIVAVAGEATQGTAGLRFAATTATVAASATSAFAFFRNCNYFLLYHLHAGALRVSYWVAYFNFSSITLSTSSKLSSLDSTIFGVCL